MFFSPKTISFISLIAFLLFFFTIDLNKLPTTHSALEEIARILSKNTDCNLCGIVLHDLDVFHQAQSTLLSRATQGYDKPHSAFIRACEQDPNTIGCDTALDRNRVEKSKRAARVLAQVEKTSGPNEAMVSSLIRRRHKDFVNYLLAEKEQEECGTCIVEDGNTPRFMTPPQTEGILGHLWYNLFPINERHQSFCWQHCEGMLGVFEKIKLWCLRFYVTRSVRFRLLAIQREPTTIFGVLIEFLLLLTILQRYVGDTKGGGGGGNNNNNNNNNVSANTSSSSHSEGNSSVFTNTKNGGNTRRGFLGRGKGGGGKRE